MIALLKAMTVSHRRARRLDVVTVAVSVVLAGSSLAATFARGLVVPVAVLGAAWAVAYVTGLADWARSEFQRAATIQEMFDVELFGLPWNRVAAGDPATTRYRRWPARTTSSPASCRTWPGARGYASGTHGCC